jgi:signal transduction histidine kinase/HPt (histidine-containing phosphotransfer) domain-containing protein/ActR/RegA family two-component response regulator
MIAYFINHFKLHNRLLVSYIFSGVMAFFIMAITYVTFDDATRDLKNFVAFSKRSNIDLLLTAKVSEIQRQAIIYTYDGHQSAAEQVTTSYQELLEQLNQSTNESKLKTPLFNIKNHLENYHRAFLQVTQQRTLQRQLINVEFRHYANDVEALMTQLIEQSNHSTASEIELYRTLNTLLLVEKNAFRYMDTLDISHVITAKKSLNEAIENLENFSKKSDSQTQFKISQTIVQLHLYEKSFSEAVQRTRAYRYLVNVVMAAEAYEILYQSKQLSLATTQQMNNIENTILLNVEKTLSLILMIGSVLLLLLTSFFYIIGQSISRPILSLTETFKKLSHGTSDALIPDYCVADEIGELTNAAKAFRDKNVQTAQLLENAVKLTEELRQRKKDRERSNVLELIATGKHLPNILNAIVSGVEQEDDSVLCSILLLDKTGKHLLIGAAPSFPNFYNQAVDGLEIGYGVGSCGTAIATRKLVIVDDIQHHPFWSPFKELAAKAELGACWSQPIFSINGKILGTIAIYHRHIYVPTDEDILELEQSAYLASIAIEHDRVESDLRAAVILAQEATEMKSNFLANMSHEIRTPMNAVLGLSHLTLQTNLTEHQQNYLEKIEASGQHLLNLIDDILDLSKIEAGKMVIEQVTFSIKKLLENVARLIENQVESKGLVLKFNIASNVPPFLVGDSLRLQQILLNYCNNAVKFTENGVITMEANIIENNPDNVLLRFTISDTGIGLTKEQISQLFQSFQQADMSISRKYRGTGLGLAISKHLALLMNGEVGVESEIGQGSSFWFTAVLGKTMTTEELPTELTVFKNLQHDKTLSMMKNATILLAEDDEINQEVAIGLLEPFHFKIDIANNGKEAIEMNSKKSYDLVLMDMQMPILDGVSATIEIRKTHQNLPIIAMTANAMEREKDKCLAAGMNDHIAKPIKVEILLNTLAKWLTPRNVENKLPTIDGLNVDLAMEQIGNNEKLYLSILQKYVVSQSNAVRELREAIDADDMEKAERIAHTSSSINATIGATHLAHLAHEIEDLIRNESSREKIDEEVAQFEPELLLMIGKLKSQFVTD